MNIDFHQQILAKTNEELVEIYTNSHLYQPSFVELTKTEILKRNIPIDAVEKIKERSDTLNTETFALGKQGNPIYMALIAVSALFGGIIAIVGGYIYAYSSHRDSTGKKHFVYNESTRKWGQIIFWVGIAVLAATALYKLNSLTNEVT